MFNSRLSDLKLLLRRGRAGLRCMDRQPRLGLFEFLIGVSVLNAIREMNWCVILSERSLDFDFREGLFIGNYA